MRALLAILLLAGCGDYATPVGDAHALCVPHTWGQGHGICPPSPPDGWTPDDLSAAAPDDLSASAADDMAAPDLSAMVNDLSAPSDLAVAPDLATPGPLVLCCGGDSITQAAGNVGAYRMWVAQLAQAAGRPITFVGDLTDGTYFGTELRHSGHGGSTIESYAYWVDAYWHAFPVPSSTVLMIGINNFVPSDASKSWFKGTTVDTALVDMATLVAKIRALWPRTRLIVIKVSPLPAGFTYSTSNDPLFDPHNVDWFNDGLAAAVAPSGAEVLDPHWVQTDVPPLNDQHPTHAAIVKLGTAVWDDL